MKVLSLAKYEFFTGTQIIEIERPEVPPIVAKQGIRAEIPGNRYSLVILNPQEEGVEDVSYKAK